MTVRGFGEWLDKRLPVLSAWKHMVSTWRVPKNLNFWSVFGVITVLLVVNQMVTGVLLSAHYVPHVDLAFESVQHITRDVNYGWLILNLHRVGTSALFIALYLHMYQAVMYGSYKAPRELLWVFSMLLYVVFMVQSFSGYVLPWGQMCFWGATVITNLFSAIPWVGEGLTHWLWGGYSVHNPTLTRFYALHATVLPLVIVVLYVLYVIALRVSGPNHPDGTDIRQSSHQGTVPLVPYQVVKDLFGVVLFAVVFAAVVYFAPNMFAHPDNYIKANPMVTPAHIVPEWYLLPFYAVLRSVPDKLLGVLAMAAAIALLFVLPWLDRSPVRSLRYKGWPSKLAFVLFVASVVVLGYAGAMPAEGIYLLVARIATAMYFGFFVCLPFITRLEKCSTPPASIASE